MGHFSTLFYDKAFSITLGSACGGSGVIFYFKAHNSLNGIDVAFLDEGFAESTLVGFLGGYWLGSKLWPWIDPEKLEGVLELMDISFVFILKLR